MRQRNAKSRHKPSPRKSSHAVASPFIDPTTFTPHFAWKAQTKPNDRGRDELYCENVRLDDVADAYGTPTYLYSSAAIT
ncbi:MAG TPA: hypothetical protein VE545_09635, partial [Candidatus Dormibacteraeota bacterium]|nr:hypothetical protein [Candidatus Dormibacteraeota bacterium]